MLASGKAQTEQQLADARHRAEKLDSLAEELASQVADARREAAQHQDAFRRVSVLS